MTNKPGLASQWTKMLRDELILGRTRSGDKWLMYHCANGMLQGLYTFSTTTKGYSQDRCPYPVYFNIISK